MPSTILFRVEQFIKLSHRLHGEKGFFMVIKGKVVGYQVYQSGACQLFVTSDASSNDKVHEYGQIVRNLWQGKGTYDFANPPHLIDSTVIAFVGRNESGIIDIQLPKGGDK